VTHVKGHNGRYDLLEDF